MGHIWRKCIECEDDFSETNLSDVLIVNEGTFGWSNGSISLYNPTNKTVSQNLFSQVNAINQTHMHICLGMKSYIYSLQRTPHYHTADTHIHQMARTLEEVMQ